MGHKFAEIAFTDTVKKIQQEQGSRENYAGWEQGPDYHDTVGIKEADFIGQSDSFYMSSVSETGWPYVQHRGGPPGFMRVIDENTIGFADYRGNRQYVSAGNFMHNDRVALFFMDYLNRRRLKVLGRIKVVGKDESEILAKLNTEGYRGRIERGFLITVKAFDWNCPQHITPRYSQSQVEELMAPIIKENEQLKSKLGMTMESIEISRPPVPPFSLETARQKVRLAEDGWNSRDPDKVSLAYTVDSQWRNRSEFLSGREQIVELLTQKWTREREYRLIKELWAFKDTRIAVRFAYESHDVNDQWVRSYGNENWEFNEFGLMTHRQASINDLPISEEERLFDWTLGRRPDDFPSLSDLNL